MPMTLGQRHEEKSSRHTGTLIDLTLVDIMFSIIMIKVLVSTREYYILVSLSIVTACSRAILNILPKILCFKHFFHITLTQFSVAFENGKRVKETFKFPKKMAGTCLVCHDMMVSSVHSQHKNPGFNLEVAFLCGICMFSLCLGGFPAGAPVARRNQKHVSQVDIQSVPLIKCNDEDQDLDNVYPLLLRGGWGNCREQISLYVAVYI